MTLQPSLPAVAPLQQDNTDPLSSSYGGMLKDNNNENANVPNQGTALLI